MADDSAELVEQTATALVQAMATHQGEWAPVREELSALFAKAAHVASAELERSRTEVVQDPALAGEAIGEWKAKLRRLVRANPETAAPMREILGRLSTADVQPRVSNTTGNVTGVSVQAHTIHGGAGNTTTYGGDHVEQSHIRAGRDVIGVQNNHRHGRDSGRER
ncbi:hypothetical protein SAMN05421803_1462 [Nocardiopsis flavescens]|uniref:Uncharacterized protein n=1 Tax=Nocardiopsis flavescens TaxID=758803 RepID=A0A1M6WKL7_9ACTN|nr:hypothetical protein [Nocardiopsis flavescens]SHK94343.1 hypothetical protein SAMN05421803_1462 [Nocardiopsis flavescens]